MKSIFCLVLLLTSSWSLANERPVNVKERLRLSLWYQGLKEDSPTPANIARLKRNLPEELERPLRKI